MATTLGGARIVRERLHQGLAGGCLPLFVRTLINPPRVSSPHV